MAALVQTYPAQTTSMMQRPGSSERYNSGNGSHHTSRSQQKYANFSATGYRGSAGPAPTYAFTSTPQLGNSLQWQQPGQQPRASSSTSAVPQLPQLNLGSPNLSQQPPQLSALPSFNSLGSLSSQINFDEPQITPPVVNAAAGVKPSPDRYRRNVRRTDSGEYSGGRSTANGQVYSQTGQSTNTPNMTPYQSYRSSTYNPGTQSRNTSNDDLQTGRQQPELASRYRRRSLGNIDVAGLNHTGDAQDTVSPHPNALIQTPGTPGDYMAPSNPHRPHSSHAHTGSSESVTSLRSVRSSRPDSARDASSNPSTPPSGSGASNLNSASRQDPRLNVPLRGPETIRRNPSPLGNPSPLSKPVNLNTGSNPSVAPRLQQNERPFTPKISSPAAEHLAALNMKEQKKPKSKLRRAFSFGSAAELRKATAQSQYERNVNTINKRSSKYEDELEPEQARIAEKQEAGGLGESIYSGQGQFFTGSTDNFSISSTASSASIMLRKMGKGMKKGTRSFVGLFRPKSVLGVPAADGPVNEGSAAQLSMVTVEAEREKVNVNLNPHEQVGGGTAFPKLERNSMDNKMSMDSASASQDSRSRRSIVGGEKERAEVLAAVKKGILKRVDSNQSSPSLRPVESKGSNFALPAISQMTDSPRSSAPSTPVSEPPRSGHRRTDSITVETSDHPDYFSSNDDRYASIDSKTDAPLTPQATSRNISFSPRIQFHDTWPSGEYDRRGEIATCNRLTPMLAQQIKEELNTFKMEMEVHESSKVYTHFF